MRSRRRHALAALLVASAFAYPATLRAACDPTLNIGSCLSSDLLWPRPGPYRFGFVGSTEIPQPNSFDLGLVTTYQRRPIILHVPTPSPEGTDTYPIDHQVSSTFVASFGVARRLAVFAAVPWTTYQSGAGDHALTGHGALPTFTLRDPRAGAALSILPPSADTRVSAAFVADVQVPTGSTSDFAGERGFVFAPSLVGQWRFAPRFVAAVELDGRIRPVVRSFVGEHQGTQLLAAAGVSFEVIRDVFAVGVESRGVANLTSETAFGAEWMASLRSAFRSPFGVLLGGGSGFAGDGLFGAPGLRFVLGLSFTPGSASSTNVPAAKPVAPEPAPPAPLPPSTPAPAPVAPVVETPAPAPAPELVCSAQCKADPAAPLTEKEEARLAAGLERWLTDLQACFPRDAHPYVLLRFGPGGVKTGQKIEGADAADAACTSGLSARIPPMTTTHRGVVRCERQCR